MSQFLVSLDTVRHVAACKTAFYDVSAPWSLSLRHFDTSVRRRLDASRRHVKKARHLGSTCRREASSTLPTHVSRCRSDASAMWRLGFTKFDPRRHVRRAAAARRPRQPSPMVTEEACKNSAKSIFAKMQNFCILCQDYLILQVSSRGQGQGGGARERRGGADQGGEAQARGRALVRSAAAAAAARGAA